MDATHTVPTVSVPDAEEFFTNGSQAYPPETSEISTDCSGVDMPGVGHVDVGMCLSTKLNPSQKETALAEEAKPVPAPSGNGSPCGAPERICLKCGKKDELWDAETRPEVEVYLHLLGLNQCAERGRISKGTPSIHIDAQSKHPAAWTTKINYPAPMWPLTINLASHEKAESHESTEASVSATPGVAERTSVVPGGICTNTFIARRACVWCHRRA